MAGSFKQEDEVVLDQVFNELMIYCQSLVVAEVNYHMQIKQRPW